MEDKFDYEKFNKDRAVAEKTICNAITELLLKYPSITITKVKSRVSSKKVEISIDVKEKLK